MVSTPLVTGGILPSNPAGAVRGPKYVVKRGKTPVLSADQARQLLDSIDVTELRGFGAFPRGNSRQNDEDARTPKIGQEKNHGAARGRSQSPDRTRGWQADGRDPRHCAP
jgi:hypothetical protein